MKLAFSALAILCCAFTTHESFGQTATPNYLGAVGVTALKTSALTLHRNALKIDDYAVQLTANANRQAGSAAFPPICAKEYKVKFDLHAGSDMSAGGGSGFYIYRTREATHESDGTWGEWFPAKKTSTGAPNRLDLLHFDTWRDWITVNNQTVYQRDGNSIYYWTFQGGHQDVLGINAQLNQTMPFTMEGSGWFNVVMHFKGGKLFITVSRNGAAVMTRTVDSYYEEKIPHHIIVSAWTGASKNVQSTRNFAFEGIVPDDCSPPFNEEQMNQHLATACGAFTSSTCPEACVKATAQGLFEEGKISLVLYESAVRSCQAGLCSAAVTTSYTNGFTAGVASIDIAGIKSAAFTAGSTAGYTKGFAEGVASVDVDAIKELAYDEGAAAGYQEGHTDGVASMQSKVTEAYNSGAVACNAGLQAKIDAAYLKGLLADKVTICHRQPKKEPVTLSISRSALAAHLTQHGDTIGPCPAADNTKKGR